MTSSNNNKSKRRIIRKCKRGSGEAKTNVIRIKESVRSDLQFIKVVIGIHPDSSGRCYWESHKDVQAEKEWTIIFR